VILHAENPVGATKGRIRAGRGSDGYRKDIDGLRAIAVLAVIMFHLGYLPSGYLGVDVFFVISGYLITRIVFTEVAENRFSITYFYVRRVRRILPLALFTASVALFIGAFVMLPDDFENLSESVVATNCFANNILLLITTGNYWDVVNEYKPLMHTWSLGIEEQFYLFYPVIFWWLGGRRTRWILPLLALLAATSFFLYLTSPNEAAQFYSIPYRFFELSVGGLGAIACRNRTVHGLVKVTSLVAILALLTLPFDLPRRVILPVVVIAALGVLLPGAAGQGAWSWVLENRALVGIGVISYSLYMWHQIVLAFTRYCISPRIGPLEAVGLIGLIFPLSIASYFVIERPFRDKRRIGTRPLLLGTSSLFLVSTVAGLYGYSRAGVLHDVPELGIVTSSVERNMHGQYNARIYQHDSGFSDSGRIKVLVVGDSFARDWANVLLESEHREQIELSYVPDIHECSKVPDRLRQAQYVFFSRAAKAQVDAILQEHGVDSEKVWNVGTKNFGVSNGIFYNRRGCADYCCQRTAMENGTLEENAELRRQWGARYVDLIGMVIDDKGTVPVFTPECKLISQDCRHLTVAGARYFARLLEDSNRFNIEP
jgi:peptidoglycan/LPS O-acetylase OafA/YrhL